ncbi:MAG: permease [Candidatus Omnitrophica bacterium]|nr:permease [Candidatus Omnitrophota bacterium]
MSSEHPASCCHNPEAPASRPWFTNKTVLAIGLVLCFVGLSYRFEALVLFRENLVMYFRAITAAVALGFVLGGILERYVPREYVSRLLAEKKKRSIFFAVLLGFLMSACSHGILALSMELHKKGASTPVVVAFLLASPWANLPITLMLLGFFGWKALYIILGALWVAFNTGLVFQWLEKRCWVEANRHTLEVKEGFSILEDVKKRAQGYRFSLAGLKRDIAAIFKGSISLADMTLPWILIGVVLSGLAAAFIPAQFFHRYMGPSALGLLATLGLATVMEVCSEGTAPLAFEIFKQTGAFGNAFVFLMAGVVTDLTEISLVWANVGKKAAIWIPIVSVPQIAILGMLANRLFH